LTTGKNLGWCNCKNAEKLRQKKDDLSPPNGWRYRRGGRARLADIIARKFAKCAPSCGALPRPVHHERALLIFHAKNRPVVAQQYTRKRQTNKPYIAVEARKVAAPRCTMVAGPIDLSTGGKGGKTPMRKLIPIQ